MITKWLIGITAIVWLVYDVMAGKIGQPTESMVIRDWARHWTAFALFWGIVVGHWFSPRQQVNWGLAVWVIPFMVAAVVSDIYWMVNHYHDPMPWWRYPFFYSFVGLFIGAVFWQQNADYSPWM